MKFDIYDILATPYFWLTFFVVSSTYMLYEGALQGFWPYF